MNITTQKRDKYLPLEHLLKTIQKEVEAQDPSVKVLERQYAGRLSQICASLFGLNALFKLEENDQLFTTEFPSLPGVDDLAADMGDLMDKEKREAYLARSESRLEKFRAMKGGINTKRAEMTGDYKDLSFVIKIDLTALFKEYKHSATDVTTFILNEIGKIFAYADFLSGMRDDIEQDREQKDPTTPKLMAAMLERTNWNTTERIGKLRKVMDSYDNLSSEFVTELGWGRELMIASEKLKGTYFKINGYSYARVLPSILMSAFNILSASWWGLLSLVGHFYFIAMSDSTHLENTATIVLIFLFGFTLSVMITSIVYGTYKTVLAYENTLDLDVGRYKSIRKIMIKQIKQLKGKIPRRDIAQLQSNLKTIEALNDLIPKNESFWKKIFTHKSAEDMLEDLRNHELHVRHFELSLLAK